MSQSRPTNAGIPLPTHHRSSVAPSGPMGSGPWSPPASTSQQVSSAIGPVVPAASASRLPVAQKASPEKRKSSRSPSRTRGKGKKAKAAAISDDNMAAGFDHGLFQPTGPWTDDWLEHYHPCEGCRNGGQKCEVAPGKGTSCRACHAAKVGCSQTFSGAKALGRYRTWVFWKYCRNPTQYDDHRLTTVKGVLALVTEVLPWFQKIYQNNAKTGGKAEPAQTTRPRQQVEVVITTVPPHKQHRHHATRSPSNTSDPGSTSLPDPGVMSELGGPGGALHGGEIGGADDGRFRTSRPAFAQPDQLGNMAAQLHRPSQDNENFRRDSELVALQTQVTELGGNDKELHRDLDRLRGAAEEGPQNYLALFGLTRWLLSHLGYEARKRWPSPSDHASPPAGS
ncbi:hypothetical protein LXA43DRAFT_1065059 [Ganoderma leucocontextum]|nr:hypothetical protein LXA43DRAFT_1065059 [Ganoderma leucocontextum]